MDPVGPGTVIDGLDRLARRHGIPMLDEDLLAADVAILSTWPRAVFVRAMRIAWERFDGRYRRLPTVAELRGYVAAELEAVDGPRLLVERAEARVGMLRRLAARDEAARASVRERRMLASPPAPIAAAG